MGVFEEMLVNVKTAIDAVGKKTGDLLETSKLKYSEAEIKSQIRKEYEKLGQKFYEYCGSENFSKDDVKENIEKIDNLKNSIKEIRKEIEKAENKCKCCNCGSKNAKGSSYCCNCGEQLLKN